MTADGPGGSAAERAYTANLLGALGHALADRLDAAGTDVVGHGATAPAALVSLHWYPGRPVRWLAARLRISKPGAVQLVNRLEAAGLVERGVERPAGVRPLHLTPAGERLASRVLARRAQVLADAVAPLSAAQVRSLATAAGAVLGGLSRDLLGSEHVCRLCDEAACPDARCPVERAVPSPVHRRGLGYGVTDTFDA